MIETFEKIPTARLIKNNKCYNVTVTVQMPTMPGIRLVSFYQALKQGKA